VEATTVVGSSGSGRCLGTGGGGGGAPNPLPACKAASDFSTACSRKAGRNAAEEDSKSELATTRSSIMVAESKKVSRGRFNLRPRFSLKEDNFEFYIS